MQVDLGEFPLQPGDLLLACTDGLTDIVDDEAISSILTDLAGEFKLACGRLKYTTQLTHLFNAIHNAITPACQNLYAFIVIDICDNNIFNRHRQVKLPFNSTFPSRGKEF